MNMEKPEEIQSGTQQVSVKSFDDPKYLERRLLIHKTDEEIIKEGTKEGYSFSDSSVTYLTNCIEENKLFFSEFVGCNKMTDIGCSNIGVPVAVNIRNSIKSINSFDLVDPFEDEASVLGEKKNELFKFFKTDGLSFLIEQESSSTNMMTASIDIALIPSGDYLRRLAQEIYRVTSEEGFYVSANSEELEEEAVKLFPYMKEFGLIKVFYKKFIEGSQKYIEELKGIINNYRHVLNFDSLDFSAQYRKTELLDYYITIIRGALETEDFAQIYSAIRQYINQGSHTRKDNYIESIRKNLNVFLIKNFGELVTEIEKEIGRTIEE